MRCIMKCGVYILHSGLRLKLCMFVGARVYCRHTDRCGGGRGTRSISWRNNVVAGQHADETVDRFQSLLRHNLSRKAGQC